MSRRLFIFTRVFKKYTLLKQLKPTRTRSNNTETEDRATARRGAGRPSRHQPHSRTRRRRTLTENVIEAPWRGTPKSRRVRRQRAPWASPLWSAGAGTSVGMYTILPLPILYGVWASPLWSAGAGTSVGRYTILPLPILNSVWASPLWSAGAGTSVGMYTILPLPIWYGIWDTKGGSRGEWVVYCAVVVQ